MKRLLRLLSCAGCVLTLMTATALAAPELSMVFPDNDVVTPGGKLGITFEASEAAKLVVCLVAEDKTRTELAPVDVAAGAGEWSWDGRIDDADASGGMWTIEVSLENAAGERSATEAIKVEVTGQGSAPAKAEQPAGTEASAVVHGGRQVSPFTDPHENCYWRMNPDDYDLTNPDDQKKIWDIMMQPITVLDTGPTDHIYPLVKPGADIEDISNLTGQLHGTTQGVHVIEQGSDGWSLVEAYSNDGYRAPDEDALHAFDAQLIHGYVRTSQLREVKPNATTALLIDKLTQRLYIFENGKLIAELLISTGFPTAKQPYLETPAGEYLSASKVGAFKNGKMTCDLAIRINGGVLLHEVPHLSMADETRNYTPFEPYLGQKASHGCVRIQRMKSNTDFNAGWLWNNLKKNSKVLIWDDVGRSVPPQPAGTMVYYNPEGGKSYHCDPNCAAVKERFLPLSELPYEQLYVEPYTKLIPCYGCLPPPRATDLTTVEIPDDVIGSGTDDI